MDVQTFVSEALRQIVAGISDAQRAIADLNVGARVNPIHDTGIHPESTIDFDIAVTVSTSAQDGASSKAGGSIGAGILSVVRAQVGAEIAEQSGKSEANQSVSRVKFAVRLAQPGDAVPNNPRPLAYNRYKEV